MDPERNEAMESNPRLECRGVTKRMRSGDRTLTILDRVDLMIGTREFCAILGPSGSGKSTLLGLLAGLDRPTEGEVLVDGTPLGNRSESDLARLRRHTIGFVFQSFHLLDNLTARQNVLLPLELNGVEDARSRTDALLARVGLEERGHHYPSQLSGGEQQRVALARAFAADPPILLADEPTGNLDAENGTRVLELLLDLRERSGTTLVLVTHDASIAARAERCLHVAGGRIVREESVA